MTEPVTIPARFNGPLESGNGGYAGGVLAPLVPGSAAISLRSPVPLDTPLDPVPADEGVRVMNGETLVAEVSPAAEVDLEVPEPVGVEEARAAARNYRGTAEGLFGRCFVCGRAREDGFDVFAGAVAGREGLVASPWTPPAWTADDEGNVRDEFVWAVLDCPTYFALYPDSYPLSFLVRMRARVDAPVRAGEEHVVIAWPIEKHGRKHLAGSAVLSAGGEVLVMAEGLLIDTGGVQA